MAINYSAALDSLREAGARINRLGPETSLREALQLIADTAVKLIGPEAAAVIYTYDAGRSAFDPNSRVAAGEQTAVVGDVPRGDGVGATAIRRKARVLSYESGRPFHPSKYQAGIRTSACYPLLVGEQPVGALYIDLRANRRFHEDELRLLDTFVPLSAVAIYNTRQFEGINRQLQQRVDELERLQNAGRLITSRPSLDATLNEILNSALDLIGAEFGSFRLLDKNSNQLTLAASKPQVSAESGRVFPISETDSVTGWVAFHRRAVLIPDLRAEPWNKIYRILHPSREMRSELAVPLLGAGGGLEGVVNLESPRVAAFTSDHLRVLEALATQASIALQEAKLLAALEELTGALAGRSRSELFNLLIAQACDLLNVPHCIVWERDPQDPSTLRWRASNADIPADYRVDIANSFLGEAILTRQPAYSADMRTDARVQRRTLVAQLGWVSALVVPLLSRDGQSRGAFSIYTQEQRLFSDWEQRLVMTLANHAAVAFQQAEALSEIKLAQERQTVAETFAVLGDVSANLLHRVNNLVGVIPQLTESLRAKRPDLESDEAASKKLADIETSARQAMTVARETFAFLRPFQLEPVSVAQCYQTALTRLDNSGRVTVVASGLENLPPVLAGEEQLRLVLFNLMENAVEAIGEQSGEVKLVGRVVADMLRPGHQLVELTLADSGPGVAAEHRDSIFDATFSTKGIGRKLGFGLWWVKSWIQRFGGSITLAEPEPTFSGCTFIIRLPVASAS